MELCSFLVFKIQKLILLIGIQNVIIEKKNDKSTKFNQIKIFKI